MSYCEHCGLSLCYERGGDGGGPDGCWFRGRRVAYRYACQACAHGLLGTVGPEPHGDDCPFYVNPERATDGAWWLGYLGLVLGPVAGYIFGIDKACGAVTQCEDPTRCPVMERVWRLHR